MAQTLWLSSCGPSHWVTAKSTYRLNGTWKCCRWKKCGTMNATWRYAIKRTYSSSTAANASLLLVTSTFTKRIRFFSPESAWIVWWTFRNKLITRNRHLTRLNRREKLINQRYSPVLLALELQSVLYDTEHVWKDSAGFCFTPDLLCDTFLFRFN